SPGFGGGGCVRNGARRRRHASAAHDDQCTVYAPPRLRGTGRVRGHLRRRRRAAAGVGRGQADRRGESGGARAEKAMTRGGFRGLQESALRCEIGLLMIDARGKIVMPGPASQCLPWVSLMGVEATKMSSSHRGEKA